MFILEWLTDYMNTPKMEMTGDVELLGMLAIGIIAFLVIGACWLIGYIITLVKVIKEKKGRKR
jgi:hypothetical protein